MQMRRECELSQLLRKDGGAVGVGGHEFAGAAAAGVVVDETGGPLKVQDQHKKQVKYQVIARDGYRAKQEVE